MQVTSLFATLFAFLTLITPLATLALQITIPADITSPGSATIRFTNEDTDPAGPLTLFLVQNQVHKQLAKNVPASGVVSVDIPADLRGNGWSIRAENENTQVATSPPFSLAASPSSKPPSKGNAPGGPVTIAIVIVCVLVLALAVLGLFLYLRRRRQRFAGPEFTVEAPPKHGQSRSFSSASEESVDVEEKARQWEMELEGQFARARAGTPDIPRISAAPRGAAAKTALRGTSPRSAPRSPVQGAPPPVVVLPLAPLRSAARGTNYR